MRPAFSAILGVVSFISACTFPQSQRARSDPLTHVLSDALADDALLEFAGLARDTLRWRLRMSIPQISAADSARLAKRLRSAYVQIIRDSAKRELYVETSRFEMRSDTARLEARFGARWLCRSKWDGSFAAYAYRFIRRSGEWRVAERISLGHGDAAPCVS